MRSEDLRPHLMISDTPKVKLREYDGGGSTYPRPDYKEHAKTLNRKADELRAIFAKAGATESGNRLYYRVQLGKDASVLSTTGSKIEDDLHVKLLASPEKNVAYVSTSPDGFSMLIEQLSDYQNSEDSKGKSKFAIVESIGPIPAQEKVSTILNEAVSTNAFMGEALVTIFPDLSRKDQELAKRSIEEYLAPYGGKVLDTLETEEGLVLRVKIKPEAKALNDLAEAFPIVQSIDPVEEVIETSAVTGERLPPALEVAANPGKAKVCIFDSGVVKNSKILAGSIIAHEEPIGPAYSVEHGTFVASRIIFGDSLRDQVASGKLQPDVQVLSVCMITHDDIGNRVPAKGEQFLRILRDTVSRWHKEIKVYNLSMNLVLGDTKTGALVTDDNVGLVAAEIDKLSKQYGVLFVLTAGNIPISPLAPVPADPYPAYFKHESSRLCRPAEAMLALTVGSIATLENAGSMAGQSMPSPFTRRGPGFAGYRKPDMAAHGGNYTKQWATFNDLSAVGLAADGISIAYGNGTSYAAPLISRLAALLFASIPNAMVDLVRAMLIHFTTLPEWPNWNDEELIQLLGNGVPDSSRLLASNRWDQSFLFQGKIGYREILELPFYVPKQLLERKCNNKLRVRVTVAFSPETSRVLKRGYCKSHLQTKIQKLGTDGNPVDVPVGESLEVITDKYSTIIRCDRPFSRAAVGGNWNLVIEHRSRWKLRNAETPFAAVVSIIDPKSEPSVDISAYVQNAVPNRYSSATRVAERLRV